MNSERNESEPRSAKGRRKPAEPCGDTAAAGHWVEIARQWEQVGPPLRPSAQDIAFYTEAIDRWARDNGAPRALILGLTPELYRLPWPKGADLLAIDNTQAMIDAVWPGPRDAALCAEWTAMPLKADSRDIVLCDGGVHLLAYPHEHRTFVQSLHRVIVPGGLCIFRLFVPPAQRESPDAVLQDLLAKRIPNLNLLKMRLAMALHESIAEGVELKRVWDAIHQVAPDFGRLASRINWSLKHLLAINTYRNCETRYSFITLADVRDLFCRSPGGFEVDAVRVPTYELGDRCPTIVLRRSP